MAISNNSLLRYAVGISVVIHMAFLLVAFGKGIDDFDKHAMTVTVQTKTVLPKVDNVADITALNNNQSNNQTAENSSAVLSGAVTSDDDSKTNAMRYVDMIRQRIQHALVYPQSARSSGIEGKTYVKFAIDARGNVISVTVAGSSGSRVLDEASVKAVHSAAPYPGIPHELHRESMTFVLGLAFTLK